jgi:hypothetical protein
VLAGLVSGCITPTPQELEVAESARAQATILLGSFEKAMQQKDVRLLQPLLAPTLRPREVRELENHARAAMLLEAYTGYTLDLEAAFARVHWQDWSRGDLHTWVRGTNRYDETFRDRFRLVEARGAWWIRDFSLDQPRAGDHIVPSERIKAQILPKAAQLLERLKNRELATIYYDLPDDPAARNRMPVQTFWGRIFQGEAPPAISVLDERGRRVSVCPSQRRGSCLRDTLRMAGRGRQGTGRDADGDQVPAARGRLDLLRAAPVRPGLCLQLTPRRGGSRCQLRCGDLACGCRLSQTKPKRFLVLSFPPANPAATSWSS